MLLAGWLTGQSPTMADGVPPNVAPMSDTSEVRDDLSVLTLKFEVVDNRPDWPVLTIHVDGKNPFAKIAKDWRGFDPGQMLGHDSPLIPDDQGRRVAVYRCSCGEPGCGVIAPFILASPDQKRVSWVDFRDYVGVFVAPTSREVEQHDGTPWNMPDIHFDRDRYLAEVERARGDRSWETPPRETARLLHERLGSMGLVLPPNLALAWVTPAWAEEGAVLMFQHMTCEPEYNIQQQMLRLTSTHTDPAKAADDMANQLLSLSPDDWIRTFGHHVS